MSRLRDEKGMVLLLVLAVVALLTSLLTEFAFSTLVDLRLTETFRDSTRAWYMAKGGVEAGRMILKFDANSYDHPSELWGIGVPNYPVKENGVVSVTIEDLSGKLNLNDLLDASGNPNTDMRPALERLFTELEQSRPEAFGDPPADMVAALMDWMDTDTDVSRQYGTGAEDEYYQRLKNPYRVKNKPLDTLEELHWVKGFKAETVELLQKYVTVYERSSQNSVINLNTAPAEVLVALHPVLSPQEAADIVDYRQSEPFKQLADLGQVIQSNSPAYSALTSAGVVQVGVKSNFFRVISHAAVGEGAETPQGARTATAVVSADGQKVHYLKVD